MAPEEEERMIRKFRRGNSNYINDGYYEEEERVPDP